MLNFFTLQNEVSALQKDVLAPIYTLHKMQENTHADLLYMTGERIAKYQDFIEEIISSKVVWLVFKVIKVLGGAPQLSEEDFTNFTGYIQAGGLDSLLGMLEADDMFKAFEIELCKLPPDIQANAPQMLRRSRLLHKDFIDAYFKREWGCMNDVCPQLLVRQQETDRFISDLIELAENRWSQVRQN